LKIQFYNDLSKKPRILIASLGQIVFNWAILVEDLSIRSRPFGAASYSQGKICWVYSKSASTGTAGIKEVISISSLTSAVRGV